MILAHGTIHDDTSLPELLATLEADCIRTLATKSITPETVIVACDTLAQRVAAGAYDHVLKQFMTEFQIGEAQLEAALELFSRESLEYKCCMELNDITAPLRHGNRTIERQRHPLGVLFHIAAGNVDGLPAYSVVEGLLAGNVNILKLPSGDSGISVLLLAELCSIEPALADFIYVFDVASTDLASLQQFADMADGIVVWGGDEAVKAARRMASCNTKVIAWGHKLSFAYATVEATDEDLAAIAHNICQTSQLLCSSCQGIYVDTTDRATLEQFGERFFRILQNISAGYPAITAGLRAKATLHLYTEQLEQHASCNTIHRGHGVSVTVTDDSALTLALLHRNCWVKPLPREQIVPTLKASRGRAGCSVPSTTGQR